MGVSKIEEYDVTGYFLIKVILAKYAVIQCDCWGIVLQFCDIELGDSSGIEDAFPLVLGEVEGDG
jgi:hypothetical protein